MEQNKALSLPEKRLAGNSNCLNCGTGLSGPFCHYCGQPDKNLMRFFPVLIREMAEDFLDFDSRFMRTMKPLLFKPGRLTRDYLDGRRFRYTPPLRLYIFASIVFLTVAALLTSTAVEFALDNESGDSTIQIGTGTGAGLTEKVLSESEFEEAKKAIEDLDPAIREHIKVNEDDQTIEASIGSTGNDWKMQFNDEPWDRENNPLVIPFLPQVINDWINDEIEQSPEKSKAIEENPNLIVDQVFDVLPGVLFILLPLAALIMKFWYLFAKKYYVEHLIFALHNHSFLFVVFLLSMLSNALKAWLEPASEGWLTTAVMCFNIAILAWIPIYFLVALKTVYRQGWIMTLCKYILVSTSYFILLMTVTVFVALLSFLLM